MDRARGRSILGIRQGYSRDRARGRSILVIGQEYSRDRARLGVFSGYG